MGIALFSSLGLPGLNGFVGEFLIFRGVFPLAWVAATFSVLGLLVTAAVILTVIQKVFTGPVPEHWADFPDLTWRRTAIDGAGHWLDDADWIDASTDSEHREPDSGEPAGTLEILMLAWTIYLSFAGALVLALLPRGNAALARWFALTVSVVGLAIAAIGICCGRRPRPRDTRRFAVGAIDGHSLSCSPPMASAACWCCSPDSQPSPAVLFCWNIEHRTNEFFAFYLALIGGVYGVFLSFDLFLLFVFYEIAIVPKYFLIAIWGSTRREYGAMKLALYSFVGSAMVLIGLLAAYASAGSHSTDWIELAQPVAGEFPDVGVPAGVYRLRDSRGPVAVSHVGADRPRCRADGCFDAAGWRRDEARRVRMSARGDGVVSAWTDPWGFSFVGIGSWRDVFAVLAVIGIVYGALVALVQTDFKFVIGYSSVSHMGFVLLGLMTLKQIGLSGAVLQMFSHGIIAGLLFAMVGRMVYDRTHTRELAELEEMHLGKRLPFAAGHLSSRAWRRWACRASQVSSRNCRCSSVRGLPSRGGQLQPA